MVDCVLAQKVGFVEEQDRLENDLRVNDPAQVILFNDRLAPESEEPSR